LDLVGFSLDLDWIGSFQKVDWIDTVGFSGVGFVSVSDVKLHRRITYSKY
jgi:hypothetical protein